MTQVRQKKRKAVVAIIAVIGLLLAAAVFWPRQKAADDGAEKAMKIETNYCDLHYPSKWEETVIIEKQGDSVAFRADLKNQGVHPLFDVCFGIENGFFYDMIRAKDGSEIGVYLVVHPVSGDGTLNQETVDLLYAMQEDMNYLCKRLPALGVPQPTEPEETIVGNTGDIEIPTPCGTLTYPGVWEPYLEMHVTDGEHYVIEFCANVDGHPQQHLFTIRIGADIDGAYQITDENGTVFLLELERLSIDLDDSWSQEQADILYAMQEAAEQLLQGLQPVIRPEEPVAEDVVFHTPYGQLCYPGAMKDAIRCEVAQGATYTVAFYGKVEGQEEQQLYDVCFGAELESPIGTVVTGDGRSVQVGMVFYPVTPDESWSQAQTDFVYAMQETANHVLDLLQMTEISAVEEVEIEGTDVMLIETPYGKLRYPQKWENNIRVEHKPGKPYLVQFYGRAGDIAEQLVFSIAFGGREGIEVTTIADAEGKAVNVYVIFAELTGAEGADKNRLYAMQEDAIWLVESLEVPSEG